MSDDCDDVYYSCEDDEEYYYSYEEGDDDDHFDFPDEERIQSLLVAWREFVRGRCEVCIETTRVITRQLERFNVTVIM